MFISIKNIFSLDNIKRFIFNWIIAFSVVVVLEIIASILGMPLGVVLIFVLVGCLYYTQHRGLL